MNATASIPDHIAESIARSRACREEAAVRAIAAGERRRVPRPDLPAFDRNALLAATHATASALAALKREVRRPFRNVTAEEAWRLASLRREATALCTLRARARGRLHGTAPVAEQDDLAAEIAARYPVAAAEEA